MHYCRYETRYRHVEPLPPCANTHDVTHTLRHYTLHNTPHTSLRPQYVIRHIGVRQDRHCCRLRLDVSVTPQRYAVTPIHYATLRRVAAPVRYYYAPRRYYCRGRCHYADIDIDIGARLVVIIIRWPL